MRLLLVLFNNIDTPVMYTVFIKTRRSSKKRKKKNVKKNCFAPCWLNIFYRNVRKRALHTTVIFRYGRVPTLVTRQILKILSD